jgi:hypothetical protein
MAPDEKNDFAVVLREKPYIPWLEKAYSLRLEKNSSAINAPDYYAF